MINDTISFVQHAFWWLLRALQCLLLDMMRSLACEPGEMIEAQAPNQW